MSNPIHVQLFAEEHEHESNLAKQMAAFDLGITASPISSSSNQLQGNSATGNVHSDDTLFCTPNNFTQSLNYIAQTLQNSNLSILLPTHFPQVLDTVHTSSFGMNEAVTMLNGLYILLSSREKQQRIHEDAQNELYTLKNELSHTKQQLQTVREELKEEERKSWELEMKKRTLEKEWLTKEKNLKNELTALNLKCVQIQRRDNQYRHELRKSELEFHKIQEKLTRMMNDKSTTSSVGSKAAAANGAVVVQQTFELSQTLRHSNLRNRTESKINNTDVELLQSTLHSYEERLGEILQENNLLRKSLHDLEEELKTVIAAKNKQAKLLWKKRHAQEGVQEEEEQEDASSDPRYKNKMPEFSPNTKVALSDFTPAQIDLPWNLAKDQVETAIKAKMVLLREKMLQIQEDEAELEQYEHTKDLVNKLKHKIDEQREVIMLQDELLRSALYSSSAENQTLQREQEEARRLSGASNDLALRSQANKLAVDTSIQLNSSSLPVFETPAHWKKRGQWNKQSNTAVKQVNDDEEGQASETSIVLSPPRSGTSSLLSWSPGEVHTESVSTQQKNEQNKKPAPSSSISTSTSSSSVIFSSSSSSSSIASSSNSSAAAPVVPASRGNRAPLFSSSSSSTSILSERDNHSVPSESSNDNAVTSQTAKLPVVSQAQTHRRTRTPASAISSISRTAGVDEDELEEERKRNEVFHSWRKDQAFDGDAYSDDLILADDEQNITMPSFRESAEGEEDIDVVSFAPPPVLSSPGATFSDQTIAFD